MNHVVIKLTPFQADLLFDILDADLINTNMSLMDKRSLAAILLKIRTAKGAEKTTEGARSP